MQFKGDKPSRSVCPGLRGPAGRAPLGRRVSTRNAPYYGDTGGCRIYGRYVPPATDPTRLSAREIGADFDELESQNNGQTNKKHDNKTPKKHEKKLSVARVPST